MKYSLTCSLLVALPLAAAFAQQDRTKPVSFDATLLAVQTVRSSYFAMDYVRGVEEADNLLKKFPRSRELAAWRIANLARSDRPKEAELAAKKLLGQNPNDAWGWFAQAFVYGYSPETSSSADALGSSLEAYKRNPGNADVIWLRASSLANNGEPKHALALIDSIASKGPLPQEMKVARATAMYSVATATRAVDEAKVDSAFALYALARASDSLDVTAYIFPASRMMNRGRMAEGYTLAKRAAEIAPLSLTPHENYWRAIDGLKERSQAQRDSEALSDVERLLRARGNIPTVLSRAANQFEIRRQPERSRALEDRIVVEHPASYVAEWTAVSRYRALRGQQRDTTIRDSTLAPRYKRALWAYVDRPTHISDRMLGDAYRELFALTDSTTNADTLLRVVRGMVQYEGINPHIAYADGSVRLAERGRDLREAERIARAGLKAGKEKMAKQKSNYETVGDYARALDWMSAFMYDALGVIAVRQNKLEEAEKQFIYARELDPNSGRAVYHLGQLAIQRGRLADAEAFFVKGVLLPGMGPNPSKAALQEVYKSRTGSLTGYDAFLSGLEETDRSNRRAEIAKSRSLPLVALKPFQLRSLDGRVVSLDSLRGKTSVINAWGMWCGPCVAEMPEFQKLVARYAGDTSVRVITISNDANTDELRAWLTKKGYSFTTLIDDGYLSRSNMRTFPTTWFLDREGRVAFTKAGWSEKLVEEFAWRIEMLKSAP